MTFDFQGQRRLNNQAVSFTDYPLFDGPWMHAKVGEGRIRITDGKRERILDFRNGSVEDR